MQSSQNQYIVTNLQRNGKLLGEVVFVESHCRATAKMQAAEKIDACHNENTIVIHIPSNLVLIKEKDRTMLLVALEHEIIYFSNLKMKNLDDTEFKTFCEIRIEQLGTYVDKLQYEQEEK